MTYTEDAGFAYTLGTGKLFCPFDKFQERAEALLGRPILTHEFAITDTWDELRAAFETEATEAINER